MTSYTALNEITEQDACLVTAHAAADGAADRADRSAYDHPDLPAPDVTQAALEACAPIVQRVYTDIARDLGRDTSSAHVWGPAGRMARTIAAMAASRYP